MNPIQTEFPLRLSTGEDIRLSIIYVSLLESLNSPKIRQACASALDLCTELSHDELEEAKGGYDAALKLKLKSGPEACLARFSRPTCSEISTCSMASGSKCTTKNVIKRIGAFPICWTVQIAGLEGMDRSMAAEICDAIVHAWRQGHHVILVTD